MKNTEIFNDYDMVVSIPQKTINDQLTHLQRLGVIQPELVLYQSVKNRQYVYQKFDSADQIPRNADGTPQGAYIDGILNPSVGITESGTNITFILNFLSGTAWFWQGNGPMAELTQFDMTGWKYGITITLDLKAVEKQDIADNKAVPQLVKDQLENFTSSMFTVNHLFMDFESTDLLRFDPNHSDAGQAGDVGLQQLVTFMQFYLQDLVRSGNPYILGYSLTTSDATNFGDQQVPDDLRPVGTTYTMYHDPNIADLSNLNFVLATKGGKGGILGTPGNFDTNWLTPGEQCDAKMVYSHARLVEKFMLEPFYNLLSDQTYSQIKDSITVGQGNGYEAGRTATPSGFQYTISDVNSGNDQYVNKYTVDISTTTDGKVNLTFKGNISLYKEVDKNMGFCTATAHATGSVDWSGVISIYTAKDKNGLPTLQTDKVFQIDNNTSSSDQNDCAKAFEWIGKILGTILDVLTLGLKQGFFEGLFDQLLGVHVPGLGSLDLALSSLGNSVSTVLIMPAGQVFFFKNPSADPLANLALELTYKSEN